MAQDNDWRLQGQDSYLMGATLCWRRYRHYPWWNPDWDHDHCDFCWATFMDRGDVPDVLREGYTNAEQVINGTITPESAIWICLQCFEDFRERFKWSVADHAP